MKITLIYPDIMPAIRNWPGYFYGGVASIAASLRNAGHRVDLLHVIKPPMREACIERIQTLAPDIVAFSSTTNQFGYVRQMSDWIRGKWPDMTQVIGGVHAILNGREVIETTTIDFVCECEGEYAFLELIDSLSGSNHSDIHAITGFRSRDRKGRVYSASPRSLIADLDGLAFPARDVFNYRKLFHEQNGYASVMANRGCPFQCAYCCNAALRRQLSGGSKDRYVRFRSVGRFIEELDIIRRDFSWVSGFNMDDDILLLDKDWATDFCNAYGREIALPFICNMHPNLLNSENVALLAEAGCEEVRVGLESGNEGIRRKVLGRTVSDDRMIEGYRLCKEAGIRIRTFVMVGLPGETPEKTLDTLHMVAFNGVSRVQASIFYPYKGTELCRRVESDGLLSDRIHDNYFDDSILDLPGYSRRQIKVFGSFFYLYVLLYRMVKRLGNPAIRITDRLLAARLTSVFLSGLIPFVALLKSLHDSIARAGRGSSMQRKGRTSGEEGD